MRQSHGLIAIAMIVLTCSCGAQLEQKQNSLGRETLQTARKIIYVSPSGNDGSQGSRASPLITIQEAIRRAQSGDVVKVMPGTYAGNIWLKPHVSLVGSGADVTTLMAEHGNILTAENVYDITVEGFTIDGIDSAEHGLFCDGQQIRSSPRNPIMVVFRQNIVKNFISHAIEGRYANFIVESNTIRSIAGDGIHCFRSRCRLFGNEISLTNIGIFLQDDRAEVTDNTIQDVRSNGIVCHNVAPCVIRNNQVTRVGGDGVVSEYSSPIIRENSIVSSFGNGIRCLSNENSHAAPKIRANIITNNQNHGIYNDRHSWSDLGREDDLGLNIITDNGKYAVYSEAERVIPARSNWWGANPPLPKLFHGNIDYHMALSEPPQ